MKVLLIIAEDKAVRHSLAAALPETDMLIFEAVTEEACRRLISLRVDAVILDDGPRFGAHAIAAVKEAAPNTPLLQLSARGDLLTKAAFSQAGANAVLHKPFSCERLQEMVEGLTAARPEQIPPPLAQSLIPAHDIALNQHQMALRWISRAAAHAEDMPRLGQSLVEAMIDIFDAVRSTVLLEQGDCVRVVACQGVPESISGALRLQYSSGLMRFFDEFACLLDRETARRSAAAEKELHLLGGQLAAPLLRDGRVIGAIVLGERARGGPYSADDRELLTLLARGTSLFFTRAMHAVDATRHHEKRDRLIESIPVGVVLMSPHRTIELINRRGEELLGVCAADVQGRSVQRLGSAFADVALRTLAESKPHSTKRYLDHVTGNALSLQAVPLDGEGVLLSLDRAVEETVAREDLAYSPFWEYLSQRVAQEVKNPMVAINTFAQLLPRKYDSEDFRDAFSRVVQNEVARINGVVETLFEFARNPKLSLRRCNINDTIREVLNSFDVELSERHIELLTDWDSAIAEAEIDPVYFAQALHNVVQNSIDAMPGGGKLSVSTKGEPERMEISVADTGPGLSTEDSERIFLPFFSTREKGMGLGLPIANRIMRQHRGDLKLVPDPTYGARFALHLPLSNGSGHQKENKEEQHADHTGN